MELDGFIIADAAVGAPDGKMYIHGGGITALKPAFVPWIQPQLAFMIRLLLEPDELAEAHTFRLAIVDPEREEVRAATEHEFGPIEDLLEPVEGEELVVQLMVTMTPIQFPREAVYSVELDVNGRRLRTMPLPVVAQPRPAG